MFEAMPSLISSHLTKTYDHNPQMLKRQNIREVPPTKEMHHKAIVVAVDVGGRIGLELDGHVRHGGVKFESG